METWHIHIRGLVQGVGFRPLVCEMARRLGLSGWVCNSSAGLEVRFNARKGDAQSFYLTLTRQAPPRAIITGSALVRVGDQAFKGFRIAPGPDGFTEAGPIRAVHSATGKASAGRSALKNGLGKIGHPASQGRPSTGPVPDPEKETPSDMLMPPVPVSENEAPCDVLMPPDVAMCQDCCRDMDLPGNLRYRYPFTTCLACGPRYSIIRELPYDRERTTMAGLTMCSRCQAEYTREGDRRMHSQTNSCPDCAIPMHVYNSAGQHVDADQAGIPQKVAESLIGGGIVAVKGVGGYLLMADAANAKAVETLRRRKRRPGKPFAVMYRDLDSASGDAFIEDVEATAILSAVAPVVLCITREEPASGICRELVAPGLDMLGIMLPYSPLFRLIMQMAGRPLIATSANISGSPIIYRDEDAVNRLGSLADLILTFDRDIVAPQDDSVVRFTHTGRRILLRRSRGMAPVYHPDPFGGRLRHTLAMGGDLKSAFAMTGHGHLIVSQYLGDQESWDSQEAWNNTMNHLCRVYGLHPRTILADAHPGYALTGIAGELAAATGADVHHIQHHEAHFAAVLAENGRLSERGPVLGIIWDGTGYGHDRQIWGGEVMLHEGREGGFRRIAHLESFPVLAGNKMNREPRLSALSVCRDLREAEVILRKKFNADEWDYHTRTLAMDVKGGGNGRPILQTTSMGRLFDAVASLAGICDINTYEGEAAARLEAAARRSIARQIPDEGGLNGSPSKNLPFAGDAYTFEIQGERIDWQPVFRAILADLSGGTVPDEIAARFICGLARLVYQLSDATGIRCVALSGGVFQNALLVGLIEQMKPAGTELLFHKQLSPNDENIGFGQLAWMALAENRAEPAGASGANYKKNQYHNINP